VLLSVRITTSISTIKSLDDRTVTEQKNWTRLPCQRRWSHRATPTYYLIAMDQW